jgi:hypothetical protein
MIRGIAPMSAADSWLQAAKLEEKRLIGEIRKSDLCRQLEAVRSVIAAYQGQTPTPQQPVDDLISDLPSPRPRVWKAS